MATVVVDAGHGGSRDVGRSTWGGAGGVEKHVTLELARRIAGHLGDRALLTRREDVNLPLAARAAFARRAGAAAFVSIHADPRTPRRVAFVHPRASTSSRALARALTPDVRVGEMAALTPEYLAPGTAACLLEIGSPSRDPRWLDATSRSIAAGIQRHLGARSAALDMRRDGTISPFATGDTTDPWLVDNDVLVEALAEFKTEHPRLDARRFPFAIVSISETPADPATPNVFAGDHVDDLDYIASLAKIAAMYASFELRSAVRDVASFTTWRTADELWAECASQLDGEITGAVPTISDASMPRYRDVFQVQSGDSIDFTAAHRGALASMIERGTNTGAATVIRALGFKYINGALVARGLYDPGTSAGLWLTGDFVDTPLRVARTLNDQLVGQAGTPRAVAKLFTLLAQRSLVDAVSSDEMLRLLGNSLPNDPPFIARNSDISLGGVARTRSFDVLHNKLGLGPLKAVNGGFNVHSEGSIVRHRDTGHRFVVAWQNMKAATDADFTAVTRLVDLLIERLLLRERLGF
jgi:hypothetical protein